VPACLIVLLGTSRRATTALAIALQSALAEAGQQDVTVIAPTGALQVAVHAACTLTLLVSDDAADTLDETRLRSALDAAGITYSVTTGSLQQQCDAAFAAMARALSPPDRAARWQWVCERCSEGGCERHLLPRQ
jgi:hypothetical protein